jgi:hypothetical protein
MKRKFGLFLMVAAAVPLAVASVAWACGVLATLTLDTKVASPGQAISATGKNYGVSTPATGTTPARVFSDVTIRLKSRSGTVLASTAPTAGGRISNTFTVPAGLSPGWYVVLATQNNADGTPKSGTPGRTTLRVQGSAQSGSSTPVAAPWSSSPPSGPAAQTAGGSQSMLPLAIGALLSLTMLAGGWMLVARKGRRPLSGPQLSV